MWGYQRVIFLAGQSLICPAFYKLEYPFLPILLGFG